MSEHINANDKTQEREQERQGPAAREDNIDIRLRHATEPSTRTLTTPLNEYLLTPTHLKLSERFLQRAVHVINKFLKRVLPNPTSPTRTRLYARLPSCGGAQNPLDHPLPQRLFPTGPYRKSFPEPCGLLCGLLVFHLFSVLIVWHCLLSCAVIKWTVYAIAIAVVLVTRLIWVMGSQTTRVV